MTAGDAELVVVGGGPGGYTAAIRAAQEGVDVTLIEQGSVGGTCLNEGCVPSKALVSATRLVRRADEGSNRGIHADVRIEPDETYAWKDDVVRRSRRGVEKLCEANGVHIVKGRGVFVDEETVRVEDEDGERTVRFENAVVATGSRPVEIDGFPFAEDGVLNSSDVLADAPPDRLVVVGGGYVGAELSTAFASMGCDVTVTEALDGILPRYERDLVRPVRRKAEKAGVEFRTGVEATEWDGEVVTDDGRIDCDAVLVAVGREPATEDVGLGEAGVTTDERGFVETGDEGRTANPRIFAVGDAAGEPMLAHAAADEGRVAAEVMSGGDATLKGRVVPEVVYTSPEIATVGLTEQEARDAGMEPLVGEIRVGTNGRALTRDEPEGRVRLVADSDGRVVGGQAVCAEASEIIAEVALAVKTEATVDDIVGTVHPHPTISETVREAAANCIGEAVHTLNR
ncbi:MAG: dihydrolipoyl dehydrogenase [Halobacteriales archaeon]